MYKVDKSVDSEARTTNFLDVGIHENAELTGVEYKTSPDAGNEFMVFHFELEGKKLSHTEWKPRDVDPDKLANKQKNQIKRIKHIVTKFISEDVFVIDSADFKGFCDSTIALLGENYKGKKVRLKVVYSFNNYTSLPNYVPFIETMEVSPENTKLEILSIDKMTKTQADVERPQQGNPFDNNTANQATSTAKTEATEPDDLPF